MTKVLKVQLSSNINIFYNKTNMQLKKIILKNLLFFHRYLIQ